MVTEPIFFKLYEHYSQQGDDDESAPAPPASPGLEDALSNLEAQSKMFKLLYLESEVVKCRKRLAFLAGM